MAVKIGDLSSEQAWTADGQFPLLPEATYNVRVVDASEGLSKAGGNPQITLDLEILDTEQKGASHREWVTYVAPKNGKAGTGGYVKAVLQALRYEIPDGDFELPSSALIGRTASVLIRHEPDYRDPEKTVAKVAAWEEASGAFTAAPGAPVSAAQKTDDDIPF